MGIMKDFDIRIRSGGDDAVGAVNELMAELHRRLLELQDSMPRWIPVSERLPDQYEIVMVGWAGRRDIGKGYLHHGKWHDPLVCKPDANQPTHWMPLPAPPTDAK